MPKKAYPIAGLEADKETVDVHTNWLVNEFNKHAAEHQLGMLDVFMIVHSFHKVIVYNIAARWVLDGFAPEKTLHLADMTWRKAIESLGRSFKAQDREIETNYARLQQEAAESPRAKGVTLRNV